MSHWTEPVGDGAPCTLEIRGLVAWRPVFMMAAAAGGETNCGTNKRMRRGKKEEEVKLLFTFIFNSQITTGSARMKCSGLPQQPLLFVVSKLLLTRRGTSRVFKMILFRPDRIKTRPKHSLSSDTRLVHCVCVLQRVFVQGPAGPALLQDHRDQPVPASQTHQPLMCLLDGAFLLSFFFFFNSCGWRQMRNPHWLSAIM